MYAKEEEGHEEEEHGETEPPEPEEELQDPVEDEDEPLIITDPVEKILQDKWDKCKKLVSVLFFVYVTEIELNVKLI